jgi:hypothetical protein
MAESIHRDYPNSIEVVYLRTVVSKVVPSSAFPFYTAFDIAMNEYRSKRLSVSEVERVAAAILKETKKENLFPTYAVCPMDYDPCKNANDEVVEICNQVKTHVQILCWKKG